MTVIKLANELFVDTNTYLCIQTVYNKAIKACFMPGDQQSAFHLLQVTRKPAVTSASNINLDVGTMGQFSLH